MRQVFVALAEAAKPTESTTDWLTAIGGLLVFAATLGLAVLAYFQIRAGRAQGEATLAIARQTCEAAQRQWQPRIIAHPFGEPTRGTGDDAAPDEMAVGYSLKNEGTGPGFNVEHGVEDGGRAKPSLGRGFSRLGFSPSDQSRTVFAVASAVASASAARRRRGRLYPSGRGAARPCAAVGFAAPNEWEAGR